MIGGLIAAACGLIDWFVSNDTRAKRMGLMHAGINVAVVVVCGLFWRDETVLALGLVAGWLRGELVDRSGALPRAH